MFVSRSISAAIRARVALQSRASHSLVVPYIHNPITSFQNGVPASLVREVPVHEKNWDFWTSSDAFRGVNPSIQGIAAVVPSGEVWVVSTGGNLSALKEGISFAVPFLTRVVAVKNPDPISMGIMTVAVKTKDGQDVNAYAVAHVKVADFCKSVAYVDPETNRNDSERAAAQVVRKTLESLVANISVGSSCEISASDKSQISEKIVSALNAKAAEFGMEISGVEVRGVYPVSASIPDKLRALDPPMHLATAAGDNLSADYWADLLSPPFFEMKKFGSAKETKTAVATSLEWSIPSPPDFHHFNQIPNMMAMQDDKTSKSP